MNEVLKVMKERRSIRAFKPDMIPQEDLDAIIEAGLWAPSGRGEQGVVSLVITNPELIRELGDDNQAIMGMEPSEKPFYGAPVVVVVLADKSAVTSMYDAPLVMENMMLAAASLGIGSIWIHRAKEEFEMDKYKQLLKDNGLDGEYEGVGHCLLGYAEGDAPEPKPRKDGRVVYIK